MIRWVAVATDPEVLEGINEGMKFIPYNTALGLFAEDATAAGVTVVLPYRAELVGNHPVLVFD